MQPVDIADGAPRPGRLHYEMVGDLGPTSIEGALSHQQAFMAATRPTVS